VKNYRLLYPRSTPLTGHLYL